MSWAEGFVLGLGFALVISSVLARCRFGWHDWTRFRLETGGKGQWRECKRCGTTDLQLFFNGSVSIERTEPMRIEKGESE